MDHQMDSMRMYFHYGYENTFLFEQLKIDSPLRLWTTCGLLFVLTVLFEAIKYARCVRCGCPSMNSHCSSNIVNENGTDGAGDLQDNGTNIRLGRNCYVGRFRSRRHRLIQTLLHTLQTALGFLIMLSVMSFNLCLIFAILVGSAVGYFFFYRSYNEIEAIDTCH